MRIKLVLVGLTVSALAAGGHLARLGAQQAEDMRSVRDRVYNEEQVARGVIAFEATCGDCHGYELEGGEEAPPAHRRHVPVELERSYSPGSLRSDPHDHAAQRHQIGVPGKNRRHHQLCSERQRLSGGRVGTARRPSTPQADQNRRLRTVAHPFAHEKAGTSEQFRAFTQMTAHCPRDGSNATAAR